MSRLFLRCVLCGRQQADGLISRATWGHLPVPPQLDTPHASGREGMLRACPQCVDRHPDWRERLGALLGRAP